MCRRFSQFFSKEAREAFERNFGVPPPEPPYSRPTFNIPPGVDIHTVLRDSENNNQVREMFWGLIPGFAKEFKQHPKLRLDLTRVEVFFDDKDNFRKDLLKSSRCLIPINCYFEWETRGKQKLPHKFELVDSPLLYLGGIYDIWRRFDGVEFYSCSIVTMNATDTLAKIHPRMPFVVDEKVIDMWLDKKFDNYEVLRMAIKPFADERMQVSPVSTKVNKVENDNPELLEAIKAHTNVQEDLFK